MKKISKLLIAFIALINLSACIITQEAAVKFDNQSSKVLCMDFLSLPDYNYWYEDRKASICPAKYN